jgi:hypothetical protein
MTTSPQSSRARAIVISLLTLAFIAGASAGVAGDRLLTPRLQLRASLGDMSAVFDRLQLSPEQRRHADSIVARSTPRSQAIMIEVAERLRAVADSVDAELRAILTPEQRVRLDSLRRGSRMLLKRRVVTPGGTRVDTLFDTSVATPRKP